MRPLDVLSCSIFVEHEKFNTIKYSVFISCFMHDRNSRSLIQFRCGVFASAWKSYQIELDVLDSAFIVELCFPWIYYMRYIFKTIFQTTCSALICCSSDKSEKYEHHFYQCFCVEFIIRSILFWYSCSTVVDSTVWRVGILKRIVKTRNAWNALMTISS